MRKLIQISFILILFTIYSGNLILGASFDCNNATTIREQTICNDPKLSKLDRQISAIFQKLNKKGEYYKEINNRHKLWISKTRDFEDHDFERQRDFLKFSASFSICLEDKIAFKECYDKISKIDLQECMGDQSNYEMTKCMISFNETLDLLEQVESQKLVEYLKVEDLESVPFFNDARDSWLDYRSAECLLYYNFYRNGSIRSIMYSSCVDKKTFDRLVWIFDGAWRSFKESSFQESTDYIYWDRVNAIDGASIMYFYSKKKSMLIVTEFGFESKDYFGRQGNIYEDIFKCF